MKYQNQFNQEIGEPIRNWQPAKMPSNTNLIGQFCILEPLNKNKHIKGLFEILHAQPEEFWTYLPYGPFPNLQAYEEWIDTALAETDSFYYAILDKKSQLPIGLCAYIRMNQLHGVVEIGHLQYSHLLQKSTAATEAMYLMMKKAFDDLGYRRYEWKCHSMNKPSWQSAERLGFKFEGIFRQHFIIKNHNRDTAWFSILDSEWPTLKSKLERWLDSSNFDLQGKQLKRLETM